MAFLQIVLVNYRNRFWIPGVYWKSLGSGKHRWRKKILPSRRSMRGPRMLSAAAVTSENDNIQSWVCRPPAAAISPLSSHQNLCIPVLQYSYIFQFFLYLNVQNDTKVTAKHVCIKQKYQNVQNCIILLSNIRMPAF